MSEEIKKLPAEKYSVDFKAIWKSIKNYRKLYYIILPITFVVAFAIAKSLPNLYTCRILLAPEVGGNSQGMSSLASLASSFSINVGETSQTGNAIRPSVYPQLTQSVDFKTSLFPVKVRKKGQKESESITYYDYLKNEWKYPWWSHFFGLMAPAKQKDTIVNKFELTGEQAMIMGMINKNVTCAIDLKSFLITIQVVEQDPYVAALLADSVKSRLQGFITEYKTNKARHDLEYAETLYKQAKKDYEHARRLYVEYVDANQGVTLLTAKQKQIDLENEMQLQYNNFLAVSAQVLTAKAKVQEVTPAFTPLQSATVPLGPSGPRRGQIVLLYVFLAALFITIYVLYKDKHLKPLLGLK